MGSGQFNNMKCSSSLSAQKNALEKMQSRRRKIPTKEKKGKTIGTCNSLICFYVYEI